MRYTIWSPKGEFSILYAAFPLSQWATLLTPHDRESQIHQHGSCPRQINMRGTTERPHSRSIRENGACWNDPLSGISSRWRVLKALHLHLGTSSESGRSAQMTRRASAARLEKRAAQSLLLTGSAPRKRERCVSCSRTSQRKSAWRVLLPGR